MTYIHKILESIVMIFFIFSFSLVSVYVPHNFNKVPVAQAGAASGGSTFIQQLVDTVIFIKTNISTTLSAASDVVSSAMDTASFALDNIIDGLAWSLAKSILSQMTGSIVNWVNSGFKGSPSFVTDFKGFVTDIADQEFGKYLEDLGGPFSFICAPFKLDVRLALAVTYDYQRTNGKAPGKSKSCTLSGAIENIDKFIDGTTNFVDTGGWNGFFAITQNPMGLTPFGSISAGLEEGGARIVNARGEELKLLEWGSGFLSSKVCEDVAGADGEREDCIVTTPGKVINEALTFQTSTGPQSLIEADEINEIIGAVFAQLTQKALTGAAGLLGLTSGTGYSYTPVSYMDQVAASGLTTDPTLFKRTLEEALLQEERYEDLIFFYQPQLLAYTLNGANPPGQRQDVSDLLADIPEIEARILDNQTYLDLMISDLDDMVVNGFSPTEFQVMVSEFYSRQDLHTESEINGAEIAWGAYVD